MEKSRVELIQEAVLSVTPERVRQNKGSTYPSQVIAANKARPKQLDTALASMAPRRPREEAAVLVDVTLMGSGKDGCLFMSDGVYMGRSFFVGKAGGHHTNTCMYRYEDLEEAGTNAGPVRSHGDVGHWCILKTREGKHIGGHVGTNAWFLALAINAVLRQLRSTKQIPQKTADPKPAPQKNFSSSVASKNKAPEPAPADPLEEKIQELIKQAAKGYTPAGGEAAKLLLERGSTKDLVTALPLAHAADKKILTAKLEQQMLALAEDARKKGDGKTADALCQAGIKLKMPAFALARAELAESGCLGEEDPTKYYESAAKWGSLDAMCCLMGRHAFLLGKIIQEDRHITSIKNISSKASSHQYELRKWLLTAANRSRDGLEMTQGAFAECRRTHSGEIFNEIMDELAQELEGARKDWDTYGEPDLSEASVRKLQRLEQRVKEQSGEAARVASEYYRMGIGTYRDIEKANDLLDKAALYGDPDACCRKARKYMERERWRAAAEYAADAALKNYMPAWALIDEINSHLPPEQQTHLPWRPKEAAPKKSTTPPPQVQAPAPAAPDRKPDQPVEQPTPERAVISQDCTEKKDTPVQPGAEPHTPDALPKPEPETETDPIQKEIDALLFLGALFQASSKNEDALNAYEEAAKLGSPLGCLMAGTMYIQGEGTPEDEAKGFQLIKQAAEDGCTDAYGKLAVLYMVPNEDNTPADLEQGMHWIQKAWEAGDTNSVSMLNELILNEGRKAFRTQRWKDGAKLMQFAAEKGSGIAAFLLAELFHLGSSNMSLVQQAEGDEQNTVLPTSRQIPGQIVEKNPEAYVHWMTIGAQHGNPDCLMTAAINLAQGEAGFSMDLAKAEEYIRRMVEIQAKEKDEDQRWIEKEQKDWLRKLQMKHLLAQGKALEAAEEYTKAEAVYAQSVELGCGEAAFAIATLYIEKKLKVQTGTTVREEFQGKAIHIWLVRGAELNDPTSTIHLAMSYATGIWGAEEDLEQAMSYGRRAAELTSQKTEDVLNSLQQEHLEHKSSTYVNEAVTYWKQKNNAKATELFQKAAATGRPGGMYSYARFLEEEFPSKDKEIINYYTRAAKMGNPDAQYQLAEAYCRGRITELNIDTALEWAAQLWENPEASSEQRNKFSYINRNWGYDLKYLELRTAGHQRARENNTANDPEFLFLRAFSDPKKGAYRYGENVLLGISQETFPNSMAMAFALGALSGDSRCILRVKELREAGYWPEDLHTGPSGEDLSIITDAWLDQKLQKKVEAGVTGPLFRAAMDILRRGGFGSHRKAVELLKRMEKGKLVTFGHWDHRGDGVMLPIRWVVAKIEKEGILLISRNLLDQCGHGEVQNWLNSTFLHTAFDAQEQKIISDRKLVFAGKENKNKVFLLGKHAASDIVSMLWKKGFPPVCCAAALAHSTLEPSPYGRLAPWWLDAGDYHAALDVMIYRGIPDNIFVRPCIWIPF